MSSIAKTQKKNKKTKCLGPVQVLRPDMTMVIAAGRSSQMVFQLKIRPYVQN